MLVNRLASRRGLRLWPFWVALASMVLFGAVVAGAAGLILWFVLGRPPVARPVPLNAAALLDLTRIALVVTGGIGGIVALVVAYRRQRIHEQADAREHGKLFNERFIAASAQLGHDSAAVRLAGVHAMAELADDSPEHLHTCVDVLCAYLRLPYVPAADGEREVRLTIIRVIGDHLRPSARTDWRDHNVDFTGAVFEGGDLDEAVFAGKSVSFRGARFVDGVLRLERARFMATVSFRGAQFSGGTVDLHGAHFATPPEFDGPTPAPPAVLLSEAEAA
ncbi:hypothetical protein [Dactylosporangium darangshiense]|uniref:hypothetical protein n=1 Tax=Dactylosporangium darangshiense TaxID=579108 RepID=UPI00363BC6BC